MKTTTITCDTCNKDITTTGNCEDWSVTVVNRSIPPNGSTVTLMAIPPIFENDLHFCSYKCIREWAIKTFKLMEGEATV